MKKKKKTATIHIVIVKEKKERMGLLTNDNGVDGSKPAASLNFKCILGRERERERGHKVAAVCAAASKAP